MAVGDEERGGADVGLWSLPNKTDSGELEMEAYNGLTEAEF